MHIGIILYPFGDSHKGLEQYIFETVCSILREAKEGLNITVFVKGNPDLSKLPQGANVVHLPNNLFWKWSLFLRSKKYGTFIFFTESAPFFLWSKSIIVFFDAAYAYFGERTFIALIKRKIIIRWRTFMMLHSRGIVAISEASKRDLVENFSILESRIQVIYPGFKTFTVEGNVPITFPEKHFFMYVGPMKERKNVFRIIQAYILFRDITTFTHELYLVGRETQGNYETLIHTLVKESKYADSIFFKTNVDDAQLKGLYRGATALVYPSLLEGFGLPILEALSFKCFVITSNTTSTREVLGTAGFLVNPRNISEISEAMKKVAKGEYSREDFEKSAAAQCASFSWGKSGREWNQLLTTMHRL